MVSQDGCALLAALARSLCVGSPAAAPFTFGASRERVKHCGGALYFLKGWGGSCLADEILFNSFPPKLQKKSETSSSFLTVVGHTSLNGVFRNC